jgi:hypothetical protein
MRVLDQGDGDDGKGGNGVQCFYLADQVCDVTFVLDRAPLTGQVDDFVEVPAKARLQGQLALAQV